MAKMTAFQFEKALDRAITACDKIPAFDGNADNFDYFCQTVKNQVMFNQIKPELEPIRTLFINSVKSKITRGVTEKISGFNDIQRWDLLQKAMSEAVSPRVARDQLAVELDVFKAKPKEKGRDYAERLRTLLNKIKATFSDAESMTITAKYERTDIRHFQRDYPNKDIKRQLETSRFNDLSEAIEYAAESEAYYAGEAANEICGYCQNKGHNEQECRKKIKDPANGNSRNRNSDGFRQIVCNKCPRLGHKASECRSSNQNNWNWNNNVNWNRNRN